MSFKAKFIRVIYGTEIRRRPFLYACLFYFLMMILLVARIFLSGGAERETTTTDADNFESTLMTKKFIWAGQSSCDSSSSTKKKAMAIIVTSARANFKERMLIRETWGNVLTYGGWRISSIVFMLGSQGHEGQEGDEEAEAEISKDLETEHNLHGDLVTQNFVDSYKNLVFKSIMSIEWLMTFCPNVQIVVKVDDDVVINVFELVKNLNLNPAILTSSSFHCYLFKGEKPHRNATSKWYVSGQDYPEADYPPFCSGTAWLAPIQVVQKMALTLKRFDQKLLWLEDVFMTGIIPDKYNAQVEIDKMSLVMMTGPNLMVNGGDPAAIEKIGHVCKAKDWYFCPACLGDAPTELFEWFDWFEHSEDGGGHRRRGKKSKIQKKFESKIFFVMQHGHDFSKHFSKTWDTIQKINHDMRSQ